MTSSQTRQEFVACYEAYYWNYGLIPSAPQELNAEFKTKFTKEDWEDCLSRPSLVEYFTERGVPNPYSPKPVLSPKQLDFLRLVTDPRDFRPLSKKLSQVKATAAELSSWMRDQTFVNLARSETDASFKNSRTEVLTSLAREATSGNLNAAKFYLELTGEYTPGAKTQVNVQLNTEVRELTQKLLEILQRHVPPETLLLIHSEIETALFPNLPTGAVGASVKPRKLGQLVEVSELSEFE